MLLTPERALRSPHVPLPVRHGDSRVGVSGRGCRAADFGQDQPQLWGGAEVACPVGM